jgi:uncharacterized YigZ family protein
MLFSDTYKEASVLGKSNLRERGSRFMAFAIPVRSEAEVKIKLHELKTFYPDATHHCFAYVLNPDKSAQRFNDDGEPGNSAGRPILRAILSADITNVLVVVVRYFGGTLLGIPGLIQAYGEAAKLALKETQPIEKYIEDLFKLTADFENEQEIHRLISRFQARVVESNYSTRVSFQLAVRQSKAVEFINTVNDNYLIHLGDRSDDKLV